MDLIPYLLQTGFLMQFRLQVAYLIDYLGRVSYVYQLVTSMSAILCVFKYVKYKLKIRGLILPVENGERHSPSILSQHLA